MLSILIVNWNTKDLLRVCLQSITQYPPSSAHEIIVVDNASSDGSAVMVCSEFPRVKLVASTVNTGYAKGNNLAFSEAKGDWLLTLNPDTEFFDGSLDVAIERLDQTPKAGSLGIQQIGVDGKVQRSVRGFPTLAGIFGDMTGLGKLLGGPVDSYRLTRFDYELEQDVAQPMGTFLLFRRSALESVGSAGAPFDEKFPIFFNEVDLLYRLKKNGWNCLYTPKAKIGVVGLPFVSVLIFAAAFVRAKGYDAGFRA